jgi:hypothetical protein
MAMSCSLKSSYFRLVLAMVGVLAGCGSDSPAKDTGDDPDSGPNADSDGALDATVGKPSTDSAVNSGGPDARVGDAGGLGAGTVDAGGLDASSASPPSGGPLTFKVSAKDVWGASGFTVAAGGCYEIETKIDDKWLDLDVPANLSGWADKNDPRIALFAPLRRVVQDDISFYQFATCVDKHLDQCFPVAEKSTLCAKSAGQLFFFVNDVSGFESNNVGTATVTIRAK